MLTPFGVLHPSAPSSKYGTNATVKVRSWPWRSGTSHSNFLRCFLFARERTFKRGSTSRGEDTLLDAHALRGTAP